MFTDSVLVTGASFDIRSTIACQARILLDYIVKGL